MNSPFAIPNGADLFLGKLPKPQPKDYEQAYENRCVRQFAARIQAKYFDSSDADERGTLRLVMQWLSEATTPQKLMNQESDEEP